MSSFELNQLTPHIYWSKPVRETDRPVLGAVIGSQSILMVDAGNSPAHANSFLEALQSLGFAVPNYIALTHYHWDHVFGAAYLEGLLCSSIETSERMREMLRLDWRDKALDQRAEDSLEFDLTRACLKVEMSNIERSRLRLRVPDITFSQRLTIDLGGISCQLILVGGDHTKDSTIVYIPEEKVVFLGDCLYSGLLNKDYIYTQQNITSLIETLLDLDADYFLFAHQDQPINRSDLAQMGDSLKAIGQAALESHGIRSNALQRLEKEMGTPLEDDVIKNLDAFLFGLTIN